MTDSNNTCKTIFPVQAVILVGGLGTRLGHLTQHTPKPLMPIVDDLCFLDILIREISRQAISEIILLAGYKSQQVIDKYDGKMINNCQISVVTEPHPMGTAGGLYLLKDRLDQQFFLLNGDSYFDFPLRKLSLTIKSQSMQQDRSENNQDPWMSIALKPDMQGDRFGHVIQTEGRITHFEEKGHVQGNVTINGGIYLCSRSLLTLLTGEPCSMEEDIFPELVRQKRLTGFCEDGYFIDIGLPESLKKARQELPQHLYRPALFLDRDNTLNHDQGYTHKVQDLQWIDGAKEAILLAQSKGYLIVVVSNQAGIGRGYYSAEALLSFHQAMQQDLLKQGCFIDALYFCPYHAEASIEKYKVANHPDRKPNAGMINQAVEEWFIDKNMSILVGDSQADMDAATNAGIKAYHFNPKDNLMSLVARIVLD